MQETLTYEGSLEILGMTANDSFAAVYNQYKLLTNNLSAVLAREHSEGADNLQTKQLVHSMKEAIDTIQEYRMAHGTDEEKVELDNFLTQQASRDSLREASTSASGLNLLVSFKMDKNQQHKSEKLPETEEFTVLSHEDNIEAGAAEEESKEEVK